ncbi:hypothetical protein KEM48_003543 [Puccinia striiformis f. sp. tritici PST-130]|nr:hypothetical protein KEM48_003543 [Puccinia striiformis f. sp. tritici PST-130]
MPRLRVWRLGLTSIKPAQGSSSRIVGSSEWLGVDAPAAAPTFGDPSIDANPVRPVEKSPMSSADDDQIKLTLTP